MEIQNTRFKHTVLSYVAGKHIRKLSYQAYHDAHVPFSRKVRLNNRKIRNVSMCNVSSEVTQTTAIKVITFIKEDLVQDGSGRSRLISLVRLANKG